MYWNMVLKEISNKDRTNQGFKFTNIAKSDSKQEPKGNTDSFNHNKQCRRIPHMYSLGEKYNNLYLTRREAECMIWLLRGKTVNGTATELKLSPRTVEFYLKNVKNKLGCRTKFQLADAVASTDLMRQVSFERELYVE